MAGTDTISSMMESAIKRGVGTRFSEHRKWIVINISSIALNLSYDDIIIFVKMVTQCHLINIAKIIETCFQGEEVHFSDTHLVGTMTSLEKPYLRLTCVSRLPELQLFLVHFN